jgi:hypothetical protein
MAIALVATLCSIRGVAADPLYWRNWSYDAGSLTGIEQAVARYFYSLDSINLDAFVFRFNSDANALAGLEAMDSDYIEADFSRADDAIEIGSFGQETRAYASESELAGNSADILVVDGPFAYIATVLTYETDVDPVGLATGIIQAMIAAEAGEGLGEYDPEGGSTGGLWDKLPALGEDQISESFWSSEDTQFYPELREPGDSAFDFAAFDGIQRVVARGYSGDIDALATPETAPADTYFLQALVAEFDTADHATASFDTLLESSADDLTGELTGDLELTTEDVELGDLGDRARAIFGTGEEEGVTVEVSVLVVQDGAFMYVVFAAGVGEDAGSMDTAKAIIGAMMDASAGEGDGEFDDTGSSIGGLWDKLPAAGDEVLGGLLPDTDEVQYP